MTVLSLFDGISAARMALERAGVKVTRYLFGDSFTVEIIAHILRENKEIREGCR